MVYIAFDAGLVHLSDVRLMSKYTRTLSEERGPRKLLTRKHGNLQCKMPCKRSPIDRRLLPSDWVEMENREVTIDRSMGFESY